MNIYQLAVEREFSIEPFGPVMTLDKAEQYQRLMDKAGKKTLIVNSTTINQKVN